MPSEQLRFWLEGIGSLAGVVALAAIALELVRARRADTRDFLFQMTNKYAEIKNAEVVALSWEFSNLEEWWLIGNREWRESFVPVYNFYDMFATSVRSKTINKKFAIKQFGRPFIRFHQKFSDVMHQVIEIEGEGINWFEDWDWLADEIVRLYPGETTASKNLKDAYEKVMPKAS
jgi:hypothetical protein